LTVTDADGAAASDALNVTVANAAPAVTAPATLSGTSGTATSFSGSFSDAGSADSHTIRWDFGDGATASGSLSTTHAYAAAGTYQATLTVTDDDGAADAATVTVTVSASATSVLKKLYTPNTAYVRGGQYANTNYANATTLDVKTHDPDFTREAYLKYDLSTVTTITSAKLRLYGQLSQSEAGGVQINVYNAANTTWSETTLTYNNRPAAGTTVRGSGTITSTSMGWLEIDLTAFIKAEKAAGRNLVTLVLRAANRTQAIAHFNSDDLTSTGNRPELAIRT
jgi:PKD repeat protein